MRRSQVRQGSEHGVDRPGVCQKTDTPHTEVFVRIGKQFLGHLTIRRAERVQCPQRTEADIRFRFGFEYRTRSGNQLRGRGVEGVAHLPLEPYVGMIDKAGESRRIDVPQIGEVRLGGFSIGKTVDAPAGAMHSGMIVAFAGIAPIQRVKRSVRLGADFQAAEPGIAREQHIRLAFPTNPLPCRSSRSMFTRLPCWFQVSSFPFHNSGSAPP